VTGFSDSRSKVWSGLPEFDATSGRVVREAPGAGSGYWVGAPTVWVEDDLTYLCYRLRLPRPERGVENRIAVSRDGVRFDDIYSLHKSALDSDSIERCCLYRTTDGIYRYAISYVDPADGRWRVDLLSADAPDAFDPDRRVTVLTADSIGAEGAKDPNVYRIGGLYVMLLSYAPTPVASASDDAMHGTGDIYNTGITRSHSGLATSANGVDWSWRGDVLSPSDDGWDSYAARLGAITYRPPVFVGLYDGSRGVEENYEERCGAAISFDLRSWERLTPWEPWVTVPHGSGSVRYVDVLEHGDGFRFYYEMALPDGSHELRVADARVE